jgi:hypothetical protein
MIWFSYFYLGPRLMLMDLSEERYKGFRTYVASFSEDPRICVRARRAEDALEQLVAYLRDLHPQSPDVRITFWPDDCGPVAATGANAHSTQPSIR